MMRPYSGVGDNLVSEVTIPTSNKATTHSDVCFNHKDCQDAVQAHAHRMRWGRAGHWEGKP